MRLRTNTSASWAGRCWPWLAAALLSMACSTPASERQKQQQAQVQTQAKTKAKAKEQKQKQLQKPAQEQAPRVDIRQDEMGFTIVEDVRISGELRAEYDNGIRLLHQEQYEPGIASLLKVTQGAPSVTAPHIDLGIAYGKAGDLERAEGSLTRALELNPRHPIPYNELGMLYRRKGQFGKARASYERALELYPSFHFARRNLAILCDIYLADSKCALEHYQAYRAAAPEDESVAKWIAELQSRVNR